MDKGDFLLGGLKSFADAYDSGLRVVFALATGATLLFAHVLIDQNIPKPLVVLAGFCVLLFGTSSIHCVGTIMEFAKVRMQVFASLVRGEDASAVDDIFKEVQKKGQMAQRQFQAGVILSMIFVGVFVIVRLLK